jgi:hypothetical protein
MTLALVVLFSFNSVVHLTDSLKPGKKRKTKKENKTEYGGAHL